MSDTIHWEGYPKVDPKATTAKIASDMRTLQLELVKAVMGSPLNSYDHRGAAQKEVTRREALAAGPPTFLKDGSLVMYDIDAGKWKDADGIYIGDNHAGDSELFASAADHVKVILEEHARCSITDRQINVQRDEALKARFAMCVRLALLRDNTAFVKKAGGWYTWCAANLPGVSVSHISRWLVIGKAANPEEALRQINEARNETNKKALGAELNKEREKTEAEKANAKAERDSAQAERDKAKAAQEALKAKAAEADRLAAELEAERAKPKLDPDAGAITQRTAPEKFTLADLVTRPMTDGVEITFSEMEMKRVASVEKQVDNMKLTDHELTLLLRQIAKRLKKSAGLSLPV